jgi:hypothetical protein
MVIGLALFTHSTFGQVGLKFNGSSATPLVLQPGDVAVFQVTGPPNAPFAALISPQTLFEITPYGILFANPNVSEAAIVYDGFDPTHPAYGFSRIPSDGSPFTQAFIPFYAGGPYAPSYTVQCLVGDPTSPGGLTLTNPIALEYDPPPPQVSSVEPNFAAPLAEVSIYGVDFNPDPASNVVRLNETICPVITATSQHIVISVPEDGRSGPISVETPSGTSVANQNYVHTWLAVAPSEFFNEVVPAVIASPISIIGAVGPNQPQDFIVHVEPNQELCVELYVWDPGTFRITGQSNTATTFYDPFLRVRRNPSQPVTVLTDDDSGPTVSAAIGLVKGSPRYVSDIAENVVVQVDSRASTSGGPFLLLLSTRPAVNMPVTVQALFPADTREGDIVAIAGTGFDPANPGQHTILLNGASTTAFAATVCTLQFFVPAGARSGPVQVDCPAGTSVYDSDSIQTWLCIHGYTEIYEVEGTTTPVTTGVLVRGQIFPSNDTDDFVLDLVAGQQIAIEVHAWDAGSGNITASYLLAATPVDPEIRILPPASLSPIFGFDQNSGPGLGAGMGIGSANPPFTAPFTGTFRVRVLSFFGWSHGDYIMAINPYP